MKTMKHCLRCGYKWESEINPKCCPKCKSYSHAKPRKRNVTTRSYDDAHDERVKENPAFAAELAKINRRSKKKG
jgi:hypothetical protein